MSKPVLYSHHLSCAVRAVWLTARAIGLELENVETDLSKGAHLSEEFLKINPQHTIPTLNDNGNILWDSHAISTYLIGKYARNDALYPANLYTRARIDQRLHFDSGVLFPRVRACNVKIFWQKGYEFSDAEVQANHAAYALLESFLQNDTYLVGNALTVADLACVTTVLNLELITPIQDDKYPKIREWLNRIAELPYFNDVNKKSLIEFSALLKHLMETNRAAAVQ